MDPKDFNKLPRWQSTLLVVGAIAAMGLIRLGMTVEVSYDPAPILASEPIAGRSFDRMVTVDLAGQPKILRTADHLIVTEPGQLACVETRTRLFRRGHRYALTLPFYCRKKLAVRRQGAYL